MNNLLVYAGGFAPTGDLLIELASRLALRELLAWGRPLHRCALLREMARTGVGLKHSRWRWGCRWGLPEHIALRRGIAAVRDARLVLFPKILPPPIHRHLRVAADAARRRIPFVLVTPYRPGEMWPEAPEPGLLETFDAIIVQDHTFAADLRRFDYRGRVEVLPLVPPRLTAITALPRLPGGAIRVGFLGRLEPNKNLRYLLEAFTLLVRDIAPDKNWELHLFGDGSERRLLQRLASELRLRDHVHFHGAITHSRVFEAIDSCHLFVNTSITEGQCLVALEVLSRGRPLVATPVGALPGILDHPAFGELAPINDSRQFAVALSRVAHAIETGAISPQGVRTRFESAYDRRKVAWRYVRLFEDLCAPASGRSR